MTQSYFQKLHPAEPDPIFGLNQTLKKDPRENKVDLLIGYYKDESDHVPIFQAIKAAERQILDKQKDLHYLPIDGHQLFLESLKELVFDNHHRSHVYAAQAVGGTSALHHIGKLISYLDNQHITIPNPTWANHNQIFDYLGMKVSHYAYYDRVNHALLWEEIKHSLKAAPAFTTVLLHASCHNPSGLDFTHQMWEELALICKTKKLLPFFDCAYQGFGTGLKEDVKSIKIFCDVLDEVLISYSCSKNFGLYGERTGALFYFNKNTQDRDKFASLIKQSMRATYSNPPRRGAMLVAEVLSHPPLYQMWQEEISQYLKRILQNRHKYREYMEKHLKKDFSYVTKGKGLFVYTGLNEKEVKELRDKEAIYLAADGRLNITSLNHTNFDYVVERLKDYL